MAHTKLNWRMVNLILQRPKEVIIGETIILSPFSICIPLAQFPKIVPLRDWLYDFGDYTIAGCGAGVFSGIAVGFTTAIDLAIFCDTWLEVAISG